MPEQKEKIFFSTLFSRGDSFPEHPPLYFTRKKKFVLLRQQN